MAEDASKNITYYLQVDKNRKQDLAPIRVWNNLKVAYDEGFIWISNFEVGQIESVEIKKLPYKKVFYCKEGKLYPLHSLLPVRKEPALLWTPIERAFPIEMPSFNHNFFEVKDKLSVRLVAEEMEKEGTALLTSVEDLGSYVETAPKVRLLPLHWVLLEKGMAMVFGKPILPLKGEVFWLRKSSLLPVGFDFELSILSEVIQDKINPERNCWVIWNQDGSYFKIEKRLLMPLTISSVRKTMKKYIDE